MAQERFTGVIQYFNKSRGFGFIKPDNGGDDLFIHHSSIKFDGVRTLLQGGHVEFSVAAVDVTGPNSTPLRSNQNTNTDDESCYRCAEFGHTARDYQRLCFNCGKPGHFTVDCVEPSRKK